MRLRLKITAAALLAGALLQATGSIASDPRSAEMLARTCAGCHGTDGVSSGIANPSIAGLNGEYLNKAMDEFAKDTRPSTIMGRIARGYSELEIKAIADYFAARPWVSSSASTKPALVEKGRGLHERSCATCHTDGGRGGPGATPRMAGQWPAYLYMQMRDMHDPGYLGPSPLLMRQLIQQLSDDDLHALAHYYASQK
ncbi:MAG: c-type cytochrome [Chromatiales bacterium]|nr:c-type cytochrome [Chromatiales bacterium]